VKLGEAHKAHRFSSPPRFLFTVVFYGHGRFSRKSAQSHAKLNRQKIKHSSALSVDLENSAKPRKPVFSI
jgi:hypothetical protein